jgi:cytoskeleton protein RodZ
MNDNPSENNSNLEHFTGSIGARLKSAREKLELTVVDVAKQLRLKPERIESLEKDDYEEMPNATFVKGYLRAYARLVNLSPEDILALFDELKPIPEIRTMPLTSKPKPASMQQKPMRLGVYLIGLTLAVLVAIWWNSITGNEPNAIANPNLPQPIKNEPTNNAAPQMSAVIQTQPVPTTPQAAPPVAPPQVAPPQTAQQATSPTTSVPSQNNNQAAAAATGVTPTEKPATTPNQSADNDASTSNNASTETENATAASDTSTTTKKSQSSRHRRQESDYYSDNDYHNRSRYSYSNNYDRDDSFD